METKTSLNALSYGQLLTSLLLLVMGCQNTEAPKTPADKIIIEASLAGDWINQASTNTGLEDKMEMKYVSTKQVAFKPPWNSVKATVSAGKATWVIYSVEPIEAISVPGTLKIISPGDSIHINYQLKVPVFSGRGFEKIRLWNQIKEIEKKTVTPTKTNFRIASAADYLHWDQHVVDKLSVQIPLIDSSRNKMSQTEYNYLKNEIVSTAESDRLNAFQGLLSKFQKQKLPDISLVDLCSMWDSTQYRHWSKWLRSQINYNGSIYIISLFNELEVGRKFGFDAKNDSLSSRDTRTYLSYTAAKQNYEGLLRERLMAYIVIQNVIYKMRSHSPFRPMILKDYYRQPGFPEFKQMVRELEEKK